jgi:RNA polymerase sigma-70 factor (ECF subfamily)
MDFPTTRISLVLGAGLKDARSQGALADLYRSYRPPLYGFLRRMGYSHEHAEDLLQGFVTDLLERNALQRFRQERGRFRSFLLVSLKHYLAHEREREGAQKRGGNLQAAPLEAADALRSGLTPEREFERRWALDLIERAMSQLQSGAHFDRLRAHLTGDAERAPYGELARELGMSEGAIKVAVHRMRRRFHHALRDEVARTVADPSEIGDELRYLLAVLSRT